LKGIDVIFCQFMNESQMDIPFFVFIYNQGIVYNTK
jgi:hypothetical protein